MQTKSIYPRGYYWIPIDFKKLIIVDHFTNIFHGYKKIRGNRCPLTRIYKLFNSLNLNSISKTKKKVKLSSSTEFFFCFSYCPAHEILSKKEIILGQRTPLLMQVDLMECYTLTQPRKFVKIIQYISENNLMSRKQKNYLVTSINE